MNCALILTTVNAPHQKHLSAPELARCLLDPAMARTVPGHMSSFFGEVQPASQREFASLFGLSESQLAAAARAFALYSGESYPLSA